MPLRRIIREIEALGIFCGKPISQCEKEVAIRLDHNFEHLLARESVITSTLKTRLVFLGRTKDKRCEQPLCRTKDERTSDQSIAFVGTPPEVHNFKSSPSSSLHKRTVSII
jgi:hypothetical protein